MEEKVFISINVKKSQIVATIPGKDNNEYSVIVVPGGYTFIRLSSQLKESMYDENSVYFSIPEDMTIRLERSFKTEELDENGNNIYKTDEKEVTAVELKEMLRNREKTVSEDWVVVRITKAQEIQQFPHTDENEKTYSLSRIITPTGETFLRKSEQIREVKGNPNIKEFSLKKDAKIRLTKIDWDKIVDYTPDNKPIYAQTQREVTAVELYDIFANRKKQQEVTPEEPARELDMNLVSMEGKLR